MRDGLFIAVVGPSGAGKDTLLKHAAEALKDRGDVVFARRVITRTCDGQTEDHDTLNPEAFEAARASGAFCVDWGAHGLFYGLPSTLLEAAEAGKAIIANVSRDVLDECLTVFGKLAIIEVTVDEPVLGQRIAARGRESATEALARTKRSRTVAVPPGADHVRIDNSGSIETANTAFVAALTSLVSEREAKTPVVAD